MIYQTTHKEFEDRNLLAELCTDARNIAVQVKQQPNLTWQQRSAVEELLIAAALVRNRFSDCEQFVHNEPKPQPHEQLFAAMEA